MRKGSTLITFLRETIADRASSILTTSTDLEGIELLELRRPVMMEFLMSHGLVKNMEYGEAYRNASFHEKFRANLEKIATQHVYQKTPKGNNLIQVSF